MAVPAFLSPLAHFLCFLRDHPKLSCLLLLLLSPPAHRILFYFTPLLLSTALCVFALITLAPYVTATDAEVERQSLLGASSQQRKSKSASSVAAPSAKGEEKQAVCLSSAPSSSFPSRSASQGASCPAQESSWMNWMKGLNDIGRAWMESRLSEQGLGLSEPANRETLLSLIEGSFAELVTSNVNYAEISAASIGDPAADRNVVQLINMDYDLATVDERRGIDRGPLRPILIESKPSEAEAPAEIAAVDSAVVPELDESGAHELPPLPVSAGKSPAMAIPNAAEPSARSNSDASQDSCITDVCSERSNEAPNCASSSKQSPHLQRDSSSADAPPDNGAPVASTHVPQTSTRIPKSPARIPYSSKLFEASRRIFMKEEQARSMLPRVSFELPGKAQAPKPSTTGSTSQTVTDLSTSIMKLPMRKFTFDRNKATVDKEGSNIHGGDVLADKEIVGEAVGRAKASITVERNSDAPHFDEDLELEEAQALVQSELKMLEVELEEVAAKLPKTDEVLAYQKTPVRSTF